MSLVGWWMWGVLEEEVLWELAWVGLVNVEWNLPLLGSFDGLGIAVILRHDGWCEGMFE